MRFPESTIPHYLPVSVSMRLYSVFLDMPLTIRSFYLTESSHAHVVLVSTAATRMMKDRLSCDAQGSLHKCSVWRTMPGQVTCTFFSCTCEKRLDSQWLSCH